jgi:hypothetical protein
MWQVASRNRVSAPPRTFRACRAAGARGVGVVAAARAIVAAGLGGKGLVAAFGTLVYTHTHTHTHTHTTASAGVISTSETRAAKCAVIGTTMRMTGHWPSQDQDLPLTFLSLFVTVTPASASASLSVFVLTPALVLSLSRTADSEATCIGEITCLALRARG